MQLDNVTKGLPRTTQPSDQKQKPKQAPPTLTAPSNNPEEAEKLMKRVNARIVKLEGSWRKGIKELDTLISGLDNLVLTHAIESCDGFLEWWSDQAKSAKEGMGEGANISILIKRLQQFEKMELKVTFEKGKLCKEYTFIVKTCVKAFQEALRNKKFKAKRVPSSLLTELTKFYDDLAKTDSVKEFEEFKKKMKNLVKKKT